MKKILLIVIMILLLGASSGCSLSSKINSNNPTVTTDNSGTKGAIGSTNDAQGSVNNLSNLQKQGLKVIEDQSFWIELGYWGKVRFVTGKTQIKGLPKLSFYLIDSKDNVLNSLPEFYGNMWILYEVKAISFKDVNKDGLKDIIVVADYILGHGENAAVPFPVGSIYFQKNKEFVTLPELDKEINEKKQNESIDMMLTFIKGKDISEETNLPRTISPAATIIPMSDSEVSPISVHRTVNFLTFEVNKKYFNDANGYAELNLKLPRLDGNYDGIPEVNKYFIGKEKFFYDELPLDSLKEINIKVEGIKDNWYRSADYKLEAVLGDIITMSADLNGGAGGVGWTGIEGDSFNLNTGKKLNLEDVFKVNKDEYMNFIYDFVSKQIMSKINNNKQSGYGGGYNFEDAYSGAGYKNIRSFDPNNFYLTKNALVVFYPKYALAAGAAGPQEFSIPFESILNILAIDVKT